MLSSIKQTFLFISICCLLSSCITSKKVNYLQPPDFYIPSYKDSITFEDYKLRVGDRLFVKVYSTDEKTNILFNGMTNNSQMMLSGTGSASDLYTYLVEKNGSITFPMIGEIQMTGLTLRQATAKLEKAIEPIFKYSSVEMHITNRFFSVLGSGKSVFIAMPQEKINIFKALAMAGDIGIYGDRKKVRLVRETDKGSTVKTFDIRSADIIHSEFFYIQPNDIIYIQTVNEKFFSITNLPGFISTAISTFSFGALVYNLLSTPASTPETTTP